MVISRRRFLGSAAVLGGAAAASALLPRSVRRAIVAGGRARTSSLRDVEHVVLLMQENRSFDHYYGTLPGVRGFADPAAPLLSTGRSVFHQPHPTRSDGYLLPFHLDGRTSAAQAIPSTGHSWPVQHASWNHGAMDGWVTAHIAADGDEVGPLTMGYFTRADLPFHFALADAFTVCDHYFSSVLGPTHPNRYVWMTGTIDPNGEAGGPALDNDVTDGRYSWETYPERLTAAGVSWRCYLDGADSGTNVLAFMRQFQRAPRSSPLVQNAMIPAPPGQFEADAAADRLPTVSWILPTLYESEHPAFLPATGAAFVARKIAAIASNLDVWNKTAFILVYDENDGLFDHVPPVTPPAGTADEFVSLRSPGGTEGGGLPIGSGFRVPAVIVSPWTVGGYVCSDLFDHTSCLQFLEKVTGVPAPNISRFRRQTFGDLTSIFRFGDPRGPVLDLPDATRALAEANRAAVELPRPTIPGITQAAPAQGSTTRPRIGARTAPPVIPSPAGGARRTP